MTYKRKNFDALTAAQKLCAVVLFAFLFLPKIGFSQLDTEHFIPPVYPSTHSWVYPREQVVYVSTPSTTPFNYTIKDGAGNVLKTGVVSNANPISYQMSAYDSDFVVRDADLNKTLPDRGLHIEADEKVYCNLRAQAGGGTRPNATSLTSKGRAALGTAFRIGHFPSPSAHINKSSTVGIYATENGTNVSIDLTTRQPVLRGAGAPSTANVINITLNKGETYVFAIKGSDSPLNRNLGMIGGLITSDKGIVVNCGSWGGNFTNTDVMDIGMDQIVGADKIGTEYAVVRGALTRNNPQHERVQVIAHQANTEVKVNGVVVATIANAGGVYYVPSNKYAANGSMFIETSKPAYAYQYMMGANDYNYKTQGMNFLPPISCKTTSFVDNIPFIEKISTKTYGGAISVVTIKGSIVDVTANGVVKNKGTAKAIPGSNYEMYKITGLTGNVAVYSNTIALVSIVGQNAAAGYGGFFSGFVETEISQEVNCLPGYLFESTGQMGTFRWFKDGTEIPGETNDSLFATETGDYTFERSLAGCKDTSAVMPAVGVNQFSFDGDTAFCTGDSVQLSIIGSGFDSLSWESGEITASVFIKTAGTTDVRIYSDITKECFIDTSVITTSTVPPEVTLKDSTVCAGTTVELDAVNPGLGFLWSTAETTQTVDVTQTGEYFVAVTDAKGCIGRDTMNLTVKNCVTPPDPPACFIMMSDFEDYVNCTGPSYDSFTQSYAGNSAWVNSAHTAGLFVHDPGTCTNIPDNNLVPNADGGKAYAGLHSPLNGTIQEVIIGTLPKKLFADQAYEITFLAYSVNVRNDPTWNNFGELDFFGIEDGSTPVLNATTQENWTTISAIPEVDHLGTSATIDSRTQWNEYSIKFTPNRNFDRMLLAPRGNFAFVGIDNITVKVAAQTIKVDTVTVCTNTETASLPFTITSGKPNEYVIDWDDAANAAGIPDVAQTAVPANNQFSLTNLGSVPAGVYTAQIKGINTVVDCEGVDSIYFVVKGCNTDAAVTKTDGREDYTPGTTTTYTIVAKNLGPSDFTGGTVSDPLPVGISASEVSWNATAYGTATSATIGNQVGALNDMVSIPVGDSVVYSVSIAVPALYKGDLVNTATISVDIDTNAVNDTATDTDFNGLCVGATTSSFVNQFNTGYKINIGENDPNWTVQWINDPTYHVYLAASYATPTSNAVIPAVAMTKAAGVWGNSSPGEYLWVCYPWIGANNSAGIHLDVDGDGVLNEYSNLNNIVGATGDAVILKFSKTFEMTAAQLEASELSFGIAADNDIMDIIVNGVSQGPKALGSYNLVPHTITNDFQLGTNTVEIIVNSGPGAAGMMIANSTIKAVDSVSLITTNPPNFCAPNVVDLTDSLWTVGSINATNLTYFEDAGTSVTVNNPQTADTGTYYIVAVNEVGCSDTAVIVVAEDPIPDAVLRSDTAICTGVSVLLQAGNTPNLFIKWTGGSSAQTLTADTTGLYKLTVTNSFGCSDSDSVNIVVNPLPVLNLRNDTAFCEGPTIDLDAENPGATYLWSTGQSAQLISTDTTGTYHVLVTDANSCEARDTMILVVNPYPDAVLRKDTSICKGESVLLQAGNTPNLFIEWTGGSSAQTLTADTTGLYKLTVTNSFGCADSDSVTVTVHPLPVVSLRNDTNICFGDSISLDAQNLGSSYLWNTTETSQVISIKNAGAYDVIVTDGFGCKGKDTVNLIINLLPVVDLGPDVALCDPNTHTLDAGIFDEYLWNDLSVDQEVTFNSTVKAFVEVTDSKGCKGSDTAKIIVNPLPVVFVGIDQEICDEDSVLLDALNPTASYSWNTGASTQQIAIKTTGTYGVEVTDTNGCFGSDSMDLVVHALPLVNIGNDTTICDGQTVVVDAGSWASVLWGGQISSQTIPITTTTKAHVDIVDANGCEGNDTIKVTVNPIPVVDLGNDTTICVGEFITLDAGNPSLNHLWNTTEITQTIIGTEGQYKVTVFDDIGCSMSDSMLIIIEEIIDPFVKKAYEFCPGDSAELWADNNINDYTISWPGISDESNYIATETGTHTSTAAGLYCSANFDLTSTKLDTPDVSIINLTKKSTVCFDVQSIFLEVQGQDLDRIDILWSTGETSFDITVEEAGTYSLVANNACESRHKINLQEFCPANLFVPNAFTPSGGGINDIWMPVGHHLSDYKVQVWNRWGQLIFTSENLYEGWDGTFNGTDAQQDVYVYKLFYSHELESGLMEKESMVGTVTLIR